MNHAHAHHSPLPLHVLAMRATIHCLTGCAIGEVAGMVIGSWLGWPAGATIALSVVLAFVTGASMTVWPLLAAGIPVRRAVALALAADTASIAVMELVDNGVMLVIPGAMMAPLTSGLFWGSMLVSLAVAGIAAFPINLWLIGRGKGHAVLHGQH